MIFIKIINFLSKFGPLWAHKGPMGIPRKLELSFGEGCRMSNIELYCFFNQNEILWNQNQTQ